jgi:hypothetical protein
MEDLKPGDKIFDQLFEAINRFDRLLIVLSASSIVSSWVETEIRTAHRRERIEGRRILFPISLLPFDSLLKWSLPDPDSGRDLAMDLRQYFIPDFRAWQTAATLRREVDRLVSALQTDG